jgi:hypothetical protein
MRFEQQAFKRLSAKPSINPIMFAHGCCAKKSCLPTLTEEPILWVRALQAALLEAQQMQVGPQEF